MEDVFWVLSHAEWLDLVDILLVAGVLFLLFTVARGTQAVQLLRGMVVVILVVFLISLPFQAFQWLVRNALDPVLILLAVIFQPELRRILERLGRAGGLLSRRAREESHDLVAAEVARAAHRLAVRRHGALVVFERETGLQEHIETGVPFEAEVKAELLQTIFHPNTALHDKAVVIRAGRIVAASCLLPVTHNPRYAGMGTRHRAAIGVTEESDAFVVVVSEETGLISVAHNGRMLRRLDLNRLRDALLAFLEHRLSGRDWTQGV